MNNLKLIYPNKKYRSQIIEYKRETLSVERSLSGANMLTHYDNINEWLKRVYCFRNNINIDEKYVPSTTYLVIRKEDDRIIGMVDIRHKLNDYLLKFGGHIGYGIRPNERKKHYGTEALKLALTKCKKMGMKKVLVTCNKTNIGSAKIIINNGGIFENDLDEGEEFNHNLISRYWIKL